MEGGHINKKFHQVVLESWIKCSSWSIDTEAGTIKENMLHLFWGIPWNPLNSPTRKKPCDRSSAKLCSAFLHQHSDRYAYRSLLCSCSTCHVVRVDSPPSTSSCFTTDGNGQHINSLQSSQEKMLYSFKICCHTFPDLANRSIRGEFKASGKWNSVVTKSLCCSQSHFSSHFWPHQEILACPGLSEGAEELSQSQFTSEGVLLLFLFLWPLRQNTCSRWNQERLANCMYLTLLGQRQSYHPSCTTLLRSQLFNLFLFLRARSPKSLLYRSRSITHSFTHWMKRSIHLVENFHS